MPKTPRSQGHVMRVPGPVAQFSTGESAYVETATDRAIGIVGWRTFTSSESGGFARLGRARGDGPGSLAGATGLVCCTEPLFHPEDALGRPEPDSVIRCSSERSGESPA
jgi:hypothetical protein